LAHTPGPWRYDASTKQIRTLDENSSRFSGELIGAVSPLNPEMPDNARLIAAAPELLEALEFIATTWPSDYPADQNAMAFARAAIAKAKVS
jgi:hypothetical protein